MGSLNYYSVVGPSKFSDYKSEAENKFKEQKLITQLESKLEQIERENGLQKSKIQLLDSKLKNCNEKGIADTLKINSLEKELKEKD